METHFYTLIPVNFGTMGLVWQEGECGFQIERVFLPQSKDEIEQRINDQFAANQSDLLPLITELSKQLQAFFAGTTVVFDLSLLALARCSDFQRRVLLTEYRIPRGRVSTYGRIANYLGQAHGARAVGNALAHNPFPIFIPCHRAVHADGGLGGFQGGSQLKQALLQLEGVRFLPGGKVPLKYFFADW